jgi:hypothetical protein
LREERDVGTWSRQVWSWVRMSAIFLEVNLPREMISRFFVFFLNDKKRRGLIDFSLFKIDKFGA